ncbi:hypothetical protein SAMN05421593_1674 [Chryseobacterium culicis]|uniref:Uncharacterized protein n=1 Tax=Chryseobacterium culicis TaxID=680127 RepID=A0A1H6HAK1_CHRCI|nr:hypothetical protein SAMN05421593_1674 [Chryseobacterium culicis]
MISESWIIKENIFSYIIKNEIFKFKILAVKNCFTEEE